MSVFQTLIDKLAYQRGNYLVLIDPDQKNDGRITGMVTAANQAGVDAILVGGSLIMDALFEQRVQQIKAAAQMPVILFPGASTQLSTHADAILFMSLISSRNPQYLIAEQVRAAPVLKHIGIEPIATGYILLDGGSTTTVAVMSNSQPLPMNKPDIVVAHALAAQYLGMHTVYLEAGSGAFESIPEAVISAVSQNVNIPVIVGGGIRSPESAAIKIQAGAKFVVTGNVLEPDGSDGLMKEFAEAIHG